MCVQRKQVEGDGDAGAGERVTATQDISAGIWKLSVLPSGRPTICVWVSHLKGFAYICSPLRRPRGVLQLQFRGSAGERQHLGGTLKLHSILLTRRLINKNCSCDVIQVSLVPVFIWTRLVSFLREAVPPKTQPVQHFNLSNHNRLVSMLLWVVEEPLKPTNRTVFFWGEGQSSTGHAEDSVLKEEMRNRFNDFVSSLTVFYVLNLKFTVGLLVFHPAAMCLFFSLPPFVVWIFNKVLVTFVSPYKSHISLFQSGLLSFSKDV